MRHKLQWFIHLRAHGLRKGDEHRANTPRGVESSLDSSRCTATTAPDVGTRHPQLQPALSSAGTDKWVLIWRLNEESDSSSCDGRPVGKLSRFEVLGAGAIRSKLALASRRPSPGHQEGRGDWRARLATAWVSAHRGKWGQLTILEKWTKN